MSYKDIRINSFNLTPKELETLYRRRYNSESTIQLDFEVNGNPSFVVLNTELQKVISSIYQLDKKLCLLSADIPSDALSQFVAVSMIEEIQQSNEVENVHSTKKELKDAYKAINNGRNDKRFVSMVRKYLIFQSDKDIPLSSCQHIRTLYNDLLLDEVVRNDPEDMPDGDLFRKSKVSIENSHHVVIHEGLFPESNIILAMNSALSILNNDDYEVLVRIALFHYFFGYIHPFYNGNGRMARFISSYLFSKHFSKAACLRISLIIKQQLKKYYDLFKNANDKRNKGELTEFVTGYLLFFKEALEETYKTLLEKNMLYQEYKEILGNWLNENIKLSNSQKLCFIIMLQSELFGDPSMDISIIAEYMDCSQKTARKLLADAGSLVYFSKDGKKQIWHINIKFLSSLGVG